MLYFAAGGAVAGGLVLVLPDTPHPALFWALAVVSYSLVKMILLKIIPQRHWVWLLFPATWAVALDFLRSLLWGNLYGFSSYLSDFPFLLKSMSVLGPRLPLFCLVLLVYALLDGIIHSSWKGWIRRGIGIGVFLVFFIWTGMSDNLSIVSHTAVMLNFSESKANKLTWNELYRDCDRLLDHYQNRIEPLGSVMLPFLPLIVPHGSEDSLWDAWGDIAMKYRQYIILGCSDTILNNQLIVVFNPLGDLIEIGEQRTFFPGPRGRVQKGDYTFAAALKLGNCGFLLNEEIFYDFPIQVLSRNQYQFVYNTSNISLAHEWPEILRALQVAALTWRMSVIANITGRGLLVIDANGSLLLNRQFETDDFLFLKIDAPGGVGCSRYAVWGDLFAYASIGFMGMMVAYFIYRYIRSE